MSATVFQQLLGAEFFHLSPALKHLHMQQGRCIWRGQVTIVRGEGLLARVAALCAGLVPVMQDAPLCVEFDSTPEREIWARDFGGVAMRSTLRPWGQVLRERLGVVMFQFRLLRRGGELHWIAEHARVLGVLPIPAAVLDGVRAREWEEEGRYHFQVDARLPVAGHVITYAGWLEPDA